VIDRPKGQDVTGGTVGENATNVPASQAQFFHRALRGSQSNTSTSSIPARTTRSANATTNSTSPIPPVASRSSRR
jgi:hypothetical protein